jgi:hypothetical protein
MTDEGRPAQVAGVTKEQTMDQFKLATAMLAVADSHWGQRDAQGRRREFTPDELAALARWDWHLPALAGILAVCEHAVRWPWRARATTPLDPTSRSSAAAPSHG